ncbi:MAG: hypothetical protein DIU79_09020 [Actinobacteria bacterium]|nr:MAG: hypothetical protein DIU79_09020 [Actinomycetota bacterium]
MIAPAALLFGLSLTGDPAMYRYVLRKKGPAFLTVFTGFAFLTNVAIAAGAAVGAVQWLISPRFRRLYEPYRGSAVVGRTLEQVGA